MEDKNYIVFDDGRVGYISLICTCEKCKERGIAEIFINDLDGVYLDCIKANDLSRVIYMGINLVAAIESLNEHYYKTIDKQRNELKYLQRIIDLYSSKLVTQ